ncbi:hypothetical protein Slala02_41170 [Streptomyces lavendulae subsp. lavendulae]|nr:hypothetical protein Slala01_41850 [Streptomyces lavendulae subsp. lavendulae]GLX28297.1 hypothetical protein Slala02_41170 [Streptomyces lavendulae subsp. lavendulae]
MPEGRGLGDLQPEGVTGVGRSTGTARPGRTTRTVRTGHTARPGRHYRIGRTTGNRRTLRTTRVATRATRRTRPFRSGCAPVRRVCAGARYGVSLVAAVHSANRRRRAGDPPEAFRAFSP